MPIMKSGTVPAYACPLEYPFLLKKGYAPPGSTWGDGIEVVRSDNGINVSITGYAHRTAVPSRGGGKWRSGISAGQGDSSYTNWGMPGAAFRIVLHCTLNPLRGIYWGP
jgi:hypothetical protein